MVTLLLSKGADSKKKNRGGDNALHISASNGQHDICRILNVHESFDVFEFDTEGKTAIDKALEAGYKELANTFSMWSCVEMRVEVNILVLQIG